MRAWFEKAKWKGKKNNNHTCGLRGQKLPPWEMTGGGGVQRYEKKRKCVYNLQISHDAEKSAQIVSILTWNTALIEKEVFVF